MDDGRPDIGVPTTVDEGDNEAGEAPGETNDEDSKMTLWKEGPGIALGLLASLKGVDLRDGDSTIIPGV